MTNLQNNLSLICKEAGLKVDLNYEIELNGKPIIALARINNIGGENGMLIFSDFKQLQGHSSELALFGFGFSILDEPSSHEIYDFDSFKDILIDWGWKEKTTK